MTNRPTTPLPTGRPTASFNLQQGDIATVNVPWKRSSLMARMEQQGGYLRNLTKHVRHE